MNSRIGQEKLSPQSQARSCSQREFKQNPTKRIKSDDQTKYNLNETEEYLRIRELFNNKILDITNTEVTKVERTRKIPADVLKENLISTINRVVGEYISRIPPKSMTDIVRILQTAQLCYSDASTSPRNRSKWKESINAKIIQLESDKTLLEKSKLNLSKLSEQETKLAKKIMRQKGLILSKPIDITEALSQLNEAVEIYKKKLTVYEHRLEFRHQNRSFELFRRRFYRNLVEEKQVEHNVPVEEIKKFWSTMWNNRDNENVKFDPYIVQQFPGDADVKFLSADEFFKIISFLPNWKAAGPDGIFNFYIKKMTNIHSYMYEIVRNICIEGKECKSWFYQGLTYLIPKGTPSKGSDFRPITCMSNLYKLTTKCVTEVMQLEVESRQLLSGNQLGTVRRIQGAKEQAMVNIALNKNFNNNLKTMWIDVKKAFDSIDHNYLFQCIESLNMPVWILSFIKSITEKWNLDIISGKDKILNKRIERGILQGDSLSPLLFVLCMDPLSRKLNSKYPMIMSNTDGNPHFTNHLLFIDDLKLIAEKEETLNLLLEETKNFFKLIGLEMNKEKSATNIKACEEDGILLDGTDSYKYLGIIENSNSKPTEETLNKIRKEIINRVEKLCVKKLKSKNLFKAINEHAISLINYYIGVLKIEPETFQEIDHDIRQVLLKYKIHYQMACKERLYLPRDEMGRGLQSISFRSEKMLLELRDNFEATQNTNTRRAAILKVEKDSSSHLYCIREYLRSKYNIEGELNNKILDQKQKDSMYSEILKRTNHAKLYKAKSNEIVSIKESSMWLKLGNNTAREEAALCNLQDRNIFMSVPGTCKHCNKAIGTVDHLATKCDRILNDYTRRHNEIVRCIHLLLCNNYKIKSSKRMRSHSIQEIVGNKEVEIRVDTRIKTDIKVPNNRPDLFVYDKKKGEITLIEVGITNQDLLQTVETEKKRKYDLLASELAIIYRAKVKIIPIVMTWDGIVTTYHKNYLRELEITNNIQAYMQSKVLKKTLESINFDFRRRGLNEEITTREEVFETNLESVEKVEVVQTA
ncbi:MAG: reverse transcriptase family protein [Candidatus Riesia sp.]|nr:reverse transcriptase family protein [Candidatus Riesia sp.]